MSSKAVHVRLEPFDVYIGRRCTEFEGSLWANPFHVPPYSLHESLSLYETHLEALLEVPGMLAEFEKLRDQTLGCWCAPKGGLKAEDRLFCHGQIILRRLKVLFH